MWLGCVISLKLHTPDSPERERGGACVRGVDAGLHVCISACAVWASVGVFVFAATNGSAAGERLASGVGGPLICSAAAEVG